jgi:predicted Rossmann fold nucleotide-binding protein DprA/Smf involved in DNA uptake
MVELFRDCYVKGDKICIDCGRGFYLGTHRFQWLIKRCPECKKKNRRLYLAKKYRKAHPKPVYKKEKVLSALFEGKKTIEELMESAGSTQTGIRYVISTLRKEGHIIVKQGSYYKRLN